MLGYTLKRIFMMVPMLLGASLAVFLMLRLGPVDPALEYLRISQIPPTPDAVAETQRVLGLDRPLATQYLSWLWDAVRLDFGTSFMTGRPVAADLAYYLPATLQLAGVALIFTLAVSLPLGIWAARHRDGPSDRAVRALAFVGVSMPNFWLGFLLVMLFSVALGILPPMGRGTAAHFVMPVIAVSLMSLSINARLLRASMLEVAGERHVTYARLRGLSPERIERAHVLRNALLPIVTATGMHVGELIGGTLVIESVFGWPGVGRYAVTAIYSHDFPVIQCFALMMVLIFVTCNLLVDLLYAVLDPRVRLGTGTLS